MAITVGIGAPCLLFIVIALLIFCYKLKRYELLVTDFSAVVWVCSCQSCHLTVMQKFGTHCPTFIVKVKSYFTSAT